jgi:hypothetical protein
MSDSGGSLRAAMPLEKLRSLTREYTEQCERTQPPAYPEASGLLQWLEDRHRPAERAPLHSALALLGCQSLLRGEDDDAAGGTRGVASPLPQNVPEPCRKCICLRAAAIAPAEKFRENQADLNTCPVTLDHHVLDIWSVCCEDHQVAVSRGSPTSPAPGRGASKGFGTTSAKSPISSPTKAAPAKVFAAPQPQKTIGAQSEGQSFDDRLRTLREQLESGAPIHVEDQD